MSDEGIDLCECIWSHEMAMRRLLSWLRQSQSYCTDTECIDLPNLPNQTPANNFILMSLFIAFALVMFVMRPRRLRNQRGDSKPYNGNGAGSSGAPPTPPPATP